ncbi:MAG: DNA translocase FtsK 4TM domain-containing protein, partial [Proteobacteria bacterium]|nr:DNA translocase FtsK 4TM domain-containing protein [Pseudomonadota bacterium]
MSQTSGATAPTTLLPEAITTFLRRRVVETGALVLVVAAIVLAASIASYASTDASFNTATGAPVENAFGSLGAYLADTMFQMIGLAGAALPIVLAAWAWRVGSHRGLSVYGLRIAALPLLILAGAALAELVLPATVTPLAMPGGWLGALLAERSVAGLAALGLQTAPVIVGIAFALLAIILFPTCLGLGTAEWRAIGGAVVALASAVAGFAMFAKRALVGFDARGLPKRVGSGLMGGAPRETGDRLEPYLLGTPPTPAHLPVDIEAEIASARIAKPKRLKTGK